MARKLTLDQARRVAIAAQGLDRPRHSVVTMRHVVGTVERLGLLQIDSVNVLARAHLLPLFARLGPYDPALLDRAAGRAPRRIVEAWAHEASYVPASTYPLVAWLRRGWASMRPDGFEARYPGLLERVLEVVSVHGPLTSREAEAFLEAEHTHRPKVDWGWSWRVSKIAMEILFDQSEIAVARRNPQFERVFDLPHRVIPQDVWERARPTREEAVRRMVQIAARAHGVGTIRCFADYFRIGQAETRAAVRQLVAEQELVSVAVAGWDRPVWLHASARVPRRVEARALLAPFDPLVFERRRLLELFGTHYRIEIYTPAERRVHGYYVLPFLLGEHIVARVDLKHVRPNILLVRSAFAEDGIPRSRGEVVAELAAELQTMAAWLGAERVVVEQGAAGELADALRDRVSSA